MLVFNRYLINAYENYELMYERKRERRIGEEEMLSMMMLLMLAIIRRKISYRKKDKKAKFTNMIVW